MYKMATIPPGESRETIPNRLDYRAAKRFQFYFPRAREKKVL